MSIILNEREWVESVVSSRQLGAHPVETLGRVARYYHQCEGYTKIDVRDKLEKFLLQCDPGAILFRWSDTLDKCAKSADRYPIIELDGVDVTESEVKAIEALAKGPHQRVAFTLLCVAKYWDAVQPRNNGWVNSSDKEIMAMANVQTTVRRQNLILYEIKSRGMIGFSKRIDNLNIRVNFFDIDSPVAIQITDFRNLGNQWTMYQGGPFLQCEHCGLTIKRRSNVQKYCAECAAEKHIQDSLELSNRRYRNLRVPPS